MFNCGDFQNCDSIAVLCRGASLSFLSQAAENFSNCFLVGQFNNALKHIRKSIRDKNIVQIINKSTTQTIESICKEYNIKDLQCNFDGWLDRELSPGRKDLYRKICKQNPWLKTHLAPPGIRERRGTTVDWATTGIFAVDLAAFFQPKRIIIFGLDFYEADYFVKERVHSSLKTNRSRGKEMRKRFLAIVERDSNISFVMYTKSSKIAGLDNLTINRV